jgi:hypothetical protein
MSNKPNSSTLGDLLVALIDRSYSKYAKPVINAVSSDPRVATALEALDAEAERLEKAGEKFTADNPVLRAFFDTLETSLGRVAGRMDAAGEDLQGAGIEAGNRIARQLALPGFSDEMLAQVNITWQRPDPVAVARLIDYANSTAWQALIDGYAPNTSTLVRNIAIRGIVAGRNPRAIAREVFNAVKTIPRYQAENIIRTIQLQSYRDAAQANYIANSSILEPYGIRIAALDARTCMACVALHGTKVPLGERITDHHQGRCIVVPQVKGFPPRNVRTGVDWFNALPENRQREQMGWGAYDAWKAGKIDLRDFVGKYTDPVFGEMIRENSLRGMLGEQAKQFYKRRGIA